MLLYFSYKQILLCFVKPNQSLINLDIVSKRKQISMGAKHNSLLVEKIALSCKLNATL